MSSRISQNMTLFMVTDLGFTLQMVALATSASFLLGLFSKVFFGWLFDLASLKGISICYVIIALSIALAFGIQGFITLMIFQLSRGFAHSGILIETPILAKHIFGPFHLGISNRHLLGNRRGRPDVWTNHGC